MRSRALEYKHALPRARGRRIHPVNLFHGDTTTGRKEDDRQRMAAVALRLDAERPHRDATLGTPNQQVGIDDFGVAPVGH